MDERQPYATTEDLATLWRPLTQEETTRAESLLPIVSDTLRQEAILAGRDLDEMIESGQVLETVVKSVTVDVTARVLMTGTDGEPMTQESQSALGYSWSGTYLNAGGGIFVKNSELKRLGLKKQRAGVCEIYDSYPRMYSHSDYENPDGN